MTDTDPDNKTQKAKSRDEHIYEQVLDAILEHRLAPATKLSEDSLAQLFEVSRTIVRKVLQRLAHEGVVEIHRNRGAVVASFTAEQVEQVFSARHVVEAAVVQSACRHITPQQVDTLKQIIRDEETAKEQQDRGKALRLSGEVHLRLADYCGNEFLASFLRALVSRCSLIIAQYESRSVELCSYEEHARVIDAIASGDEDEATALMTHHIDHIRQKINLDKPSTQPNLAEVFSSE